ncbi:MAG: type II secretion system protein N, partial [Tolumonas sp.]|nr:type II secretion system protein N [Tolumonas sp.]
SLHAPVSMISSFFRMPVPVELTGNASLAIRQLQINPQHCTQLQGSLTWQPANLSTPLGDIALGSPKASLACHGDTFTAEVTQDSDMISSQSTANMTLQGHYQLQSTLTAGRLLPENIRSSLNLMGKDIGNGVYKVNEQGAL